MKIFYALLVAAFVMPGHVIAQTSRPFSYQAVARDNGGAVISGRPISLRMSILDGSATAASLYTETFSLTTNLIGLFTASIGGGTRVSGDFAGINWALNDKYLLTEIDLNDGRGMQVAGTSQLLSVPYALYAENAGGGNNSWHVSGNNINNGNAGNVGIGTAAPLARLHVKDSIVLFTGPVTGFPAAPGLIPVTGQGIRQFWYPDKGAFRTGGLDAGSSFFPDDQAFTFPDGRHYWDRDSIGQFSFAAGYNNRAGGRSSTAFGIANNSSGGMALTNGFGNTASGEASFAGGYNSVATQGASFAAGENVTASGYGSAAFGSFDTSGGQYSFTAGRANRASGILSTAIGFNAIANGNFSTALGNYVSTNGHQGSLVIGDLPPSPDYAVGVLLDNEFRARFLGGYTFFTTKVVEGFIGVALRSGDNAWSAASDSTKKMRFLKVNGEEVLEKLGGFHSLGSWTYKGQDPKLFRHYGPMAQDFHQAFGNDSIGSSGNDTLINSADMNGILFIAAHALVERTNEMTKRTALQQASIDRLVADNQQLKADNKIIREEYARVNETLNSKLAVLEMQLEKLSLQVRAQPDKGQTVAEAK